MRSNYAHSSLTLATRAMAPQEFSAPKPESINWRRVWPLRSFATRRPQLLGEATMGSWLRIAVM
jgi:hypothetical protein